MTEAEQARRASGKLADVLAGNRGLSPRAQPPSEPPPKPAFPARALRQNWTPAG